MLDSEIKTFGDRCPKGFIKLSLLGKGGVACVWLCLDERNEKVAIKQFPKRGQKDNSALIEQQMAEQLFDGKNDKHPGLKSIARLLQVIEETKDVWLAYEVGKSPLTKHLFHVKGEFYRGERIYSVLHRDFYQALSTQGGV